ncbi:ribonuclease III [Patescibacteria group bacterium]|nr:ribonuclease III [Patescibacteria group bacterium]MBU2036258.1 ribonuclease III [Patescibacteria group bacterium]
MTDISELKPIFKNQDLLTQALTHKSWVNEHKNQRESNERLEFLGDAVLEFIVSKEIYERHPDKEEGFLTALRANLVNTQNLANIAKKLNVGKVIFLAKGEEDGGGRENSSLLADTVEAIIGALFLDQGVKPVYEFIKEHIIAEIPEKLSKPLKDAKSRLQEYIQSQKLPTPKYKVIEESGPDHNKKFIVEVSVKGRHLGQGEGKSKSTAEQKAADNALSRL